MGRNDSMSYEIVMEHKQEARSGSYDRQEEEFWIFNKKVED
jgi:hypothetical protein